MFLFASAGDVAEFPHWLRDGFPFSAKGKESFSLARWLGVAAPVRDPRAGWLLVWPGRTRLATHVPRCRFRSTDR